MTIKEFAHKHSLVFFWATIVLVVLFLLTACMDGRGRHMKIKGGYERYDKKMINRQMMDSNNPNQPLINDTPGAAGTFEAGMDADPNVPLEVQ